MVNSTVASFGPTRRSKNSQLNWRNFAQYKFLFVNCFIKTISG